MVDHKSWGYVWKLYSVKGPLQFGLSSRDSPESGGYQMDDIPTRYPCSYESCDLCLDDIKVALEMQGTHVDIIHLAPVIQLVKNVHQENMQLLKCLKLS
jgi:hypothetical protein